MGKYRIGARDSRGENRAVRISAWLLGAAFLALGLSRPTMAAKLEVLHQFSGPDGADPTGGLTINPKTGVLYGAAIYGGVGYGTVYSLTPPKPGKHKWTFDVIYTFTGGDDGAYPETGLSIFPSPADLVGTTRSGSTLCACGTLFLMYEDKGNWYKTILHDFSGDTFEGSLPNSTPVIKEGSNDVYGTTGSIGGSEGTIYRHSITGDTAVLYNPATNIGDFVGYPPQGVTVDMNGIVYGTTYYGASQGTLFRIDGSGGKILHTFEGAPDGTNPQAPPIMDANGTLYGTTARGGNPADCPQSPGCGTIWKKLAGSKKVKILHSFKFFTHHKDGLSPLSPLVLDEATGTLYGTTYYGGTGTTCGGNFGSCGTIFSVDSDGNYNVVWEFPHGGPANPLGQLVFHDRALYGTSYDGGQQCSDGHYLGCGTVWKLTP